MKPRSYTKAKSAEDYLDQRMDKTGECWEWTIGVDQDGYGQCQSSKYAKELGVSRAHQMAYKVWVGEIPPSLLVCHTCDNPTCCNPDHLFLGTNQDNVDDMVSKGRNKSGTTKTYEEYEPILKLKGKMPATEVAKAFSISWSRVYQIWRGEFHGNHQSVG